MPELREPRIWSQVSGGLPPDHPWALFGVSCATCKSALNTGMVDGAGGENRNLQVWVETASGGYCLADFTKAAAKGDGLPADLARGRRSTFVETLQSQHVPVETEHGVCCFSCSATAADSDYRVMYPCPTLQRAYELEQTSPTGA